ncbi:MAG: hypothetical protein KGY61_11650 [Desulfobacterales bacterium]|nr:hypothetical protein [Desulfobacterales bacterium]
MAKIKIDDALFAKVKNLAEKAGYSSADEFVSHMLEREINYAGEEQALDDAEVLERLKGLGYIS